MIFFLMSAPHLREELKTKECARMEAGLRFACVIDVRNCFSQLTCNYECEYGTFSSRFAELRLL